MAPSASRAPPDPQQAQLSSPGPADARRSPGAGSKPPARCCPPATPHRLARATRPSLRSAWPPPPAGRTSPRARAPASHAPRSWWDPLGARHPAPGTPPAMSQTLFTIKTWKISGVSSFLWGMVAWERLCRVVQHALPPIAPLLRCHGHGDVLIPHVPPRPPFPAPHVPTPGGLCGLGTPQPSRLTEGQQSSWSHCMETTAGGKCHNALSP